MLRDKMANGFTYFQIYIWHEKLETRYYSVLITRDLLKSTTESFNVLRQQQQQHTHTHTHSLSMTHKQEWFEFHLNLITWTKLAKKMVTFFTPVQRQYLLKRGQHISPVLTQDFRQDRFNLICTDTRLEEKMGLISSVTTQDSQPGWVPTPGPPCFPCQRPFPCPSPPSCWPLRLRWPSSWPLPVDRTGVDRNSSHCRKNEWNNKKTTPPPPHTQKKGGGVFPWLNSVSMVWFTPPPSQQSPKHTPY